MAEHFQYGNRQSRNPVDQDAINHYRIQIDKLNNALKKQEQKYTAKINHLQNLLRERGFKIFPNKDKPNHDELNIQIYKKQKQIQQLRQENAKLKKMANKPDDILIKRKDNFDALIEKDQEINRLNKIINQIQSKYDGKYFNQHKIKRDYQLLLKENSKLKACIQSYQTNQRNYQINPQTFQNIKVKKQYETIKKENHYLKEKILQYEENISKRSSDLGKNAQIQSLRIEIIDANRQNRQYCNIISSLQNENQNLRQQNVNIRLTSNPQQGIKDISQSGYTGMKKSHRRIFERTKLDILQQDQPSGSSNMNGSKKSSNNQRHQQSQSYKGSIKNENNDPQTQKKIGRYDSFKLHETYENMNVEKNKPILN